MFPNMKIAFPYCAFLILLITSCSKYENFYGYDETADDSLQNVTLVSSNEHNTNEALLFDMVNTYRSSIGLNEMQFESTTFYFAGIHNDYMIAEGQISHANFDERAETISKRTGAVHISENVAKNYDTLEEAFEGWLSSPGHRKNIEGDYTNSAISIRPNSEGEFYFTQIFFR